MSSAMEVSNLRAGQTASESGVQIKPTVLFAMNSRERSFFFPSPLEATHTKYKTHWFDPSLKSTFEKTLQELNPEVLVTSWSTPRLPDKIPSNLRYVCHVCGSVRAIVPRSYIEKDVLVSNWGSLASEDVAEHALLLILGALRKTSTWKTFCETPLSERSILQTHSLHGRRVGIHGFGQIARQLVRLLSPFNVSIASYSSGVPSDFVKSHGVIPCKTLADLMSECEVFVECEALTPQTTGSVTRELISLLPHGAVFVNVGRGKVIDENALFEISQKKGLRVALDVSHIEPIDPSSPWLNTDALISPHIGGPTTDHYPRCGNFSFENIERYFKGEKPAALVDLTIYDRST